MRVCIGCKVEKPLAEFYTNKTCPGGRTSKCKECIKAAAAKYREAHREELKKYFRTHYKENRKRILESQKEYQKIHREEKKAYLRDYYTKNKQRLLADSLVRQRNRLATDPLYKLKRQTRLLIWRSFDRKEYVKTERTEKILGCTLDEFAEHLKRTWETRYGFGWDGQPCHIDHIVPLAAARTREDVIKLCYYKNLRLLTPEDNMIKSIKDKNWRPKKY